MARPPAAPEIRVDTYFIVAQRRVSCHVCGSTYIGTKLEVSCPGCKAVLKTSDANAVKKIPTGVWNVFRDKQISNSSIIGEVISDGSSRSDE